MHHAIQTLTAYPLITLFIVAHLMIALWSYIQNNQGSFEDYALGSRSLPTGVLVMTLLGTYLSGGHLSVADRFMTYGAAHLIPNLFIILSLIGIGIFIAPKLIYFRNERTAGMVMGTFYGIGAQFFTGMISLLVCLLAISKQIAIIGRLSGSLFAIDFYTAVVLWGTLVVIYSVAGGFRSISYTDSLQMIAFFFVFGLLMQKVLHTVGGVNTLWGGMQAKFSDKLRLVSDPRFYFQIRVATFFGLPFSFILSPPIFQRMLIVKEKEVIRHAWYTVALMFGMVIMGQLLIGFSSLVGEEILGLSTRKDLIPNLAKSLFVSSPTLLSIVFIGMISIILSTIDSFLHTAGIVFVEDIIQPIQYYLNKTVTPKSKKVTYARIAIAAIGILAIILGATLDSDLRSISKKVWIPSIIVYASVNIPLIIGILGVKTNRASWISFFLAYFGSLGLFTLVGWKNDLGAHGYFDYFFVAAPFSVLLYFLTHVYKNGGIKLVDQTQYTASETLWLASWQAIRQKLGKWIYPTLHFPQMTRIEGATSSPIQSLGFSTFFFLFYMLKSLFIDLQGSEELTFFHGIGLTLCVVLMLEELWPTILKPYFPLFYFSTLFYCLPFGESLTFLRIDQGGENTLFFLGSFALLALLVRGRTFFWMSLWGLIMAHLVCYLSEGSLPANFWAGGGYSGACLAVILWILAVLFFSNQLEINASQKIYITKALASAVPHEVRDALNQISFVGISSQKVLKSLLPIQNKEGERGYFLPASMKSYVEENKHKIDEALDQVRMEFTRFQKLLDRDVASELQEKVNLHEIIQSFLPNLPAKYTQSVKVKVVCLQDFEVNLIRPFWENVLSNILKNAKRHGDATSLEITIDGNQRVLRMRDNGRGIRAQVLPYIFDLGFTTGGTANSGIGLALIRLILNASGAKIHCHSRYGEEDSFTEFTVHFPDNV